MLALQSGKYFHVRIKSQNTVHSFKATHDPSTANRCVLRKFISGVFVLKGGILLTIIHVYIKLHQMKEK